MATHIFAAIGVGSFELELGIYEISTKNGIRQIDHLHHVITLGKDTYNTGKISYELVDEMYQVLAGFKSVMDTYRVEAYRAYATSAMREAENNQIILDQILVRTGIEVEIISNPEQRLLSYKTIAVKETEFSKIIQKGTATVDVSLGSVQISLLDKGALVSTQSMKVGVLRLRELLNRIQTETRIQYSSAEELVDSGLITFKKIYLKDREIKNIVGIGESILYLFRAAGGPEVQEVEKIDIVEFKKFCERLATLPVSQIEDEFGVNAGYATLLVPSALIYKQILEMTGAEMLWIPRIRLCGGIAAEYAEKIRLVKFGRGFEDDILAASRSMSKRYRYHTSHIQNIEGFTAKIFDSMKRFHDLGERERLLLRIATILYDCGKFASVSNPSQCIYSIIMATEIIGLSHRGREIIVNVVRHNTAEFGYNQVHVENGDAGEATILVAKLTAMLRLANAMDGSHKEKMENCKLAVKENQLVISTPYEGDLSLEMIAITQKADFFEEIFGIRPVLRQKRRA